MTVHDTPAIAPEPRTEPVVAQDVQATFRFQYPRGLSQHIRCPRSTFSDMLQDHVRHRFIGPGPSPCGRTHRTDQLPVRDSGQCQHTMLPPQYRPLRTQPEHWPATADLTEQPRLLGTHQPAMSETRMGLSAGGIDECELGHYLANSNGFGQVISASDDAKVRPPVYSSRADEIPGSLPRTARHRMNAPCLHDLGARLPPGRFRQGPVAVVILAGMEVRTGLNVEPVPVLADNYAWMIEDGADAIVVDPGESVPVQAWLSDRRMRLRAILLTHHHQDHVGGVSELRNRWPDCRVFGPDDDRIAGIDQVVGDGDRIAMDHPSTGFEVLAVPGHTLSHVAFHGDGMLFCGDALFSAGCGRLFEGSPEQMLGSLDRLALLDDDTLVCCGHEYTMANCAFALTVEPVNTRLRIYADSVAARRAANQPTLPSRIGLERAVNPFLRIDEPTVREWLHATGDLSAGADRAQALAALRTAKDQFRG